MDTSAMTFVTDETFDEVVGKSALPVLFVMGATWCPDCQRIAPLMMMLAKENAGKILFAHADFDSGKILRAKMLYNIFNSIMTTCTALAAHPNLSHIQADIVINHNQIF